MGAGLGKHLLETGECFALGASVGNGRFEMEVAKAGIRFVLSWRAVRAEGDIKREET